MDFTPVNFTRVHSPLPDQRSSSFVGGVSASGVSASMERSINPDSLLGNGYLGLSSTSHTGQLMPLRDRDLKELTDLFTQDSIEDIEQDILCNLMRRAPEPCWEDDPFDFLREYL